ncbi:paired box protein Pax-7 [Trichonephila clavipes]|nr:paired box protein Pax-7 [Trichonephila clavipes]
MYSAFAAWGIINSRRAASSEVGGRGRRMGVPDHPRCPPSKLGWKRAEIILSPVWFSNRRARWRKQMGSQSYNAYGSLGFSYQHPPSYLVSDTSSYSTHSDPSSLQTGSTASLHHHHHHLHSNPSDARSSLAYNTMAECSPAIQSSFGLAIHQNDHQARRRFVEGAPNEIAVVPHFHKRILFSDEAHFWLNGYVNKQNSRIWSEANPQVYAETP